MNPSQHGGPGRSSPEPRILLVRTSAMGDVVHCLPVLTALRRRLPGARIAWAVEASMAPLLEGHPDLDLRVAVRLRSWRHAPLARSTRRELAAALGALRDFAPDLALDLMGNHKGAILARLSGAAHVLGASRRFRREPSSALWIDEGVDLTAGSAAGGGPLHAVDERMALVARAVEIVRGGAPGRDADLRGEPGPGVDFAPRRLLPHAEPVDDGGRPYAFLHPGAGWANKVYAPERWGAVARQLADRAGLETRVSVAPGEEGLARRVVASSGGTAREQPAAGLAALASLLRGARLALGGDTGPLHLAHALGVPVVMVHGPTDPLRHGPYGAPGNAVSHPLPCSFCYQRLSETKACLGMVPAERVAERALEVLAAAGAAFPHDSFE